jgi:hypothetical protein
VVSYPLHFWVLLCQSQTCHLQGVFHTPSESRAPPVKFQKVENKDQELLFVGICKKQNEGSWEMCHGNVFLLQEILRKC